MVLKNVCKNNGIGPFQNQKSLHEIDGESRKNYTLLAQRIRKNIKEYERKEILKKDMKE